MPLKKSPDLVKLFAALSHGDPDADAGAAETFAQTTAPDARERIRNQLATLVEAESLPLDEFGAEANRWFGDADEARAWLRGLSAPFADGGDASGDSVVVKDSNGTPLAEGDSVTVIKDLKVKGGSSDLKRGTLIKKIHLIGDPENIECRVDGSTLVLKTMFLRKA